MILYGGKKEQYSALKALTDRLKNILYKMYSNIMYEDIQFKFHFKFHKNIYVYITKYSCTY